MINRTIGKQKGAILILVGITLAVLLGFAGLVIDLGGLFVTKSEQQSALDSCALAAAQELNGAAGATADGTGLGGQSRATNAGLTAGNANKSQYQASSVNLIAADITFSDTLNGTFSRGFSSATARYAQCTHQTPGITAYFISLVGGSSSNSVGGLAKATLAASQITCALPLGLLPKNASGNASNNYSYQIGEWVAMVSKTAYGLGEMGWFNLDGSTNATESKNEIQFGYCASQIGQTLGTNGYKAAVAESWNARFGIYKNNPTLPANALAPDYTGYAYTSTNWKNAIPQSAYDGTPATGSHSTAANYVTKNTAPAFASYDDTGTSVNGGDAITGLSMNGFQTLATPGNNGQHASGQNRRIVVVPVLNLSYKIIDYACMLMLEPMSGPTVDVHLEYRGLASNPSSGCAVNGLGGGTAGPLVPVLVQ